MRNGELGPRGARGKTLGRKASRAREADACGAERLLSPGGPFRASHGGRAGPLTPGAGGGEREARPLPSPHPTPDPRSRPSWAALAQPGRARGRPGRKLSDGIAAGAGGRARPETPAGRAPSH